MHTDPFTPFELAWAGIALLALVASVSFACTFLMFGVA